jgi:hypothetical protein
MILALLRYEKSFNFVHLTELINIDFISQKKYEPT